MARRIASSAVVLPLAGLLADPTAIPAAS